MGLSCGGGPTLPGLGKIELEQLCSDVGRCEARGDDAVSTLKGRKARPIFLAETQGPESYLGKVAPERKAESVLKTCGSDIGKSDWLESGPTLRVVELTSDGKKSLKEALKAHLARQLLERPALLEGQEANLESIVDSATGSAGLQKVSMVSQTYWLKDAAFEKRVAQCGEEESENIIYSLTLLQMSDLSRKELESKLYTGLGAKLLADAKSDSVPAPQEPSEAAPSEALDDASAPAAAQVSSAGGEAAAADPMVARRAALTELSFAAVRALANELRLIAAFGYDAK